MNAVFGDSYYFIALLNEHDAGHEKAIALAGILDQKLITSTWVLVELADAFRRSSNKSRVGELIQTLRDDSECSILDPTPQQFSDGLRLYLARGDKPWSLTDCISFSIMRELDIHEALTADKDFEQAGLKRLLS